MGVDVASSQALTYNTVGQITTDGYVYDKIGNLTRAPRQTFNATDSNVLGNFSYLETQP